MLLDTHVLIWLLSDDDQLGPRARESLQAATAVHVSAASTWEIAIKSELGRLEVPDDLPARIDRAGLAWLPVSPAHTWAVRETSGLPHRDPFDRLLLTQARVEGLPLLTADRQLLGARLQPPVSQLDARV